MKLIEEITRHKSVAVVGLAKNAGKTECLNFILRHLPADKYNYAVTSIGIDGESRDQVTNTKKPEITISGNTLFLTSETHFRQCSPDSEILNISERRTSLGRLVTARALVPGKVMLSGPVDTASLKLFIADMQGLGVNTTLIDGALSRLSLSAPSVTDALVLATGAALSPSIPNIVAKTKFVCDLIDIPSVNEDLAMRLAKCDGIWCISEDNELHFTGFNSVLGLESKIDKVFQHGKTLFISGIVNDKLLNFLSVQPFAKEITLVVSDFSKIFVQPQTYNLFLRAGCSIKVLRATHLIAVCVNPISPQGYVLDSDKLTIALQQKLNVPVYDVVKLEQQIRDRGNIN